MPAAAAAAPFSHGTTVAAASHRPAPAPPAEGGRCRPTAVAARGSHLVGLAKSEPSLEDVFVELVGRGFGDDSDGASGAPGQ